MGWCSCLHQKRLVVVVEARLDSACGIVLMLYPLPPDLRIWPSCKIFLGRAGQPRPTPRPLRATLRGLPIIWVVQLGPSGVAHLLKDYRSRLGPAIYSQGLAESEGMGGVVPAARGEIGQPQIICTFYVWAVRLTPKEGPRFPCVTASKIPFPYTASRPNRAIECPPQSPFQSSPYIKATRSHEKKSRTRCWFFFPSSIDSSRCK